jgi:DNA polymerase I-like protein with 3'-5' exonuclease and polymerase domains
MITVLDIETTFTKEGDPTPFNPNNRLVSIGINNEYFFFYHKEMNDMKKIQENKIAIQKILDESVLVVGHNLKFDMSWMYEFGFKYEGKLYDTMLAEYVVNRGAKDKSISLKESCKRRGLSMKSDILSTYMDSGYGIDEIPMEKLEEYGKQDVAITKQLYLTQVRLYNQPGNKVLKPTRDLMNDFLRVLIDMECNGNYIDLQELDVVEKELNQEYYKLKNKIGKIIQQVMGDTKINLSSTEDLSKVIYSRKVHDKNTWATLFNIGIDKRTKKPKKRPMMTDREFSNVITKHTEQVYKTIAQQCNICSGVGYIRQLKKDGTPFKNLSKCSKCKSEGMLFIETEAKAGFNWTTKLVADVSQGGFKTDKETLNRISKLAEGSLKEFVDSVIRYSAIETYLNTFVTGIKDNVRENKVLHPSFNQHTTVTGRLSSSKPNFQNMPRGDKFPVKRVIKSRFENGEILEVDFSQLEFRTAVFLAQDVQGMKDIADGVDVHQYTADVIGCSRQDAKAHTFKPLYGGMLGKKKEKEYYEKFLKKYKDIADWHMKLQERAYSSNIVRLPSGREYYFPNVFKRVNKRTGFISYSNSTNIKNYPVQGFVTADIVPLACINVWELLKERGKKSLIINTVHDSVILDMHPDEIDDVVNIVKTGFKNVKDAMFTRYNCELNVPLDFEIKKGKNWLDLSTII